MQFERSFFAAGKPVAAICHAPWMLVEADVVRGRTATSWPSLHIDLRNADADWVDREVDPSRCAPKDRPGVLDRQREAGRTALRPAS